MYAVADLVKVDANNQTIQVWEFKFSSTREITADNVMQTVTNRQGEFMDAAKSGNFQVSLGNTTDYLSKQDGSGELQQNQQFTLSAFEIHTLSAGYRTPSDATNVNQNLINRALFK